MHWTIKTVIDAQTNNRQQAIIDALLYERGLTNQQQIEGFLHPMPPATISPQETGIDSGELSKAITLIKTAIQTKQPIIVFGDYDADGITATAIMWETLHNIGATAYPFIPNREIHGYGLSIKGLEDALSLTSGSIPLIITVDNGIVASKAVDWLTTRHIPIVITDHHQPDGAKPRAAAIVHTTSLCGAGVAWILAKTLQPSMADKTLDLACIGTIADMMPLTAANRSLVKFGLLALQQSTRPGIKALFAEAVIDEHETLTPYHVNYIIAPRLNAMGRLEHALDSLRLLCTKNQERATVLAGTLGSTNHNRQDLTQELLEKAKQSLMNFEMSQKIIILDDDQFHEGVIGLVAGKLVESYYRPAIMISRKPGVSKASARSIAGVNITELIRQHSDLLEGVGGHPMAAGFSISTEKIELFKQAMIATANQLINETLLMPTLAVDVQMEFEDLTVSLYQAIQQLQPFGVGNPQPLFATSGVVVSAQVLGREGKHLKLMVANKPDQTAIPVIWFGHGADVAQFSTNTPIKIAGTINLNNWHNRTTLQLIVKDIMYSE